jgi:hypothetical protein
VTDTWIAAGAAVAGALVGGLASYLGTYNLARREREHSTYARLAEALGKTSSALSGMDPDNYLSGTVEQWFDSWSAAVDRIPQFRSELLVLMYLTPDKVSAGIGELVEALDSTVQKTGMYMVAVAESAEDIEGPKDEAALTNAAAVKAYRSVSKLVHEEVHRPPLRLKRRSRT